MIRKPQVFVSSTSALSAERQELRERLPRCYNLYFYEDDRARGSSPERHCRQMIQHSEVLLGILGPDYGSPFPGPGEKRSIVEWEHDTAIGFDHVEIMDFLRELGPEETRDPQQQRFLDRISGFREGIWQKTYRNPNDLVQLAEQSLTQCFVEFYTRLKERGSPLTKGIRLGLVALPLMMIAGLGVFAVSGGASKITLNAMLGLCTSMMGLVVLCGILLFWQSGGSDE